VRQLKQFTVLKTGKAARHATETETEPEPKLTCHQQAVREWEWEGNGNGTGNGFQKGTPAKASKWEEFKLSVSGKTSENAAKQCYAL